MFFYFCTKSVSWFGILHIRNLCILLRKIVTYLGNFVLMDFCTVKVGKVTGSDRKAFGRKRWFQQKIVRLSHYSISNTTKGIFASENKLNGCVVYALSTRACFDVTGKQI